MVITSTKSYKLTSFLRDLALYIALVFLFYGIAALWQHQNVASYSWFLPAAFFLSYSYDLIDKERLLTIAVDEVSRQISIRYKTLFSKPREKRIRLKAQGWKYFVNEKIFRVQHSSISSKAKGKCTRSGKKTSRRSNLAKLYKARPSLD